MPTQDAMSPTASMQRQARQVLDRRLKRIAKIVNRQQGAAPERHDCSLLGLGRHSGLQFRRPGLHILELRPLPPLRKRPGIDTLFPAQLR
jgi:hypothetical protein